MPKTLPKDDPNLVKAVGRLARSQQVWGWLLIGLGAVTEFAEWQAHPLAGLPFIALGLACLRWGDPALLAAVAALVAFSIPATFSTRITLLGPDPLARLIALSGVETLAIILAKVLVIFTAANQFLMFRFLYGTARATADDPDLPVIPEMTPNRSDHLARWARWLGIAGGVCAALAWLFSVVDPTAYATRAVAELGGSLGPVAVGLGLGAAFSPTDEREAALLGAGLGLVGYLGAAVLLLRLA